MHAGSRSFGSTSKNPVSSNNFYKLALLLSGCKGQSNILNEKKTVSIVRESILKFPYLDLAFFNYLLSKF